MVRSSTIEGERNTVQVDRVSVPGLGANHDPMGFNAGDANLYRYVGNETPNATDPSGLDLARDLPPTGRPKPPKPEGKPGDVIQIRPQGDLGYLIDLFESAIVLSKPSQTAGIPSANTRPLPPNLSLGTGVNGSHYQFYNKPKPGQYVGSGGAFTCIGVIILRPDGSCGVFHFSTGDMVRPTLLQYGWPPGSTAIVFGGNNETGSNLLLGEVVSALGQIPIPVSFANYSAIWLGSDGIWYHGEPSKNIR